MESLLEYLGTRFPQNSIESPPSYKQCLVSYFDCFVIERRRRGALILGGQRYDAHRILFALLMILEAILDRIPFWWNLSEALVSGKNRGGHWWKNGID